MQMRKVQVQVSRWSLPCRRFASRDLYCSCFPSYSCTLPHGTAWPAAGLSQTPQSSSCWAPRSPASCCLRFTQPEVGIMKTGESNISMSDIRTQENNLNVCRNSIKTYTGLHQILHIKHNFRGKKAPWTHPVQVLGETTDIILTWMETNSNETKESRKARSFMLAVDMMWIREDDRLWWRWQSDDVWPQSQGTTGTAQLIETAI